MPQTDRTAGRDLSVSGKAPLPKPPAIIWQGADYPRIEPGTYQVRGVDFQGPQWVRKYQRWSLRIEFALVTEPGNASAFFNFGSDPQGPRVARHSNYWKEWVKANGDLPAKGQEMTPDVFLEGQFFCVSIEDSTLNSDGKRKTDPEVYSKITKFHSVERPQS